MNKLTIAKLFLCAVTLALSIACGGGGGGGSSTAVAQDTVDTFSIRYKTTGESWTLTGTDTAGSSYTGSSVTSVGSSTTFSGNTSIPFTTVLSLTNTTTSAFSSSTSIAYWSTDLSTYYGFLDVNDSQVTLPNTILGTFPATANIGDSGTLGTFRNTTTGLITTASWTLTRATASTAFLTLISSFSDGDRQEQVYTITPDGVRSAWTVKVFYATPGVTMTLTGTLQ
jgi:hypothetical protein